MITCPKCNKELEDGSKFCDACGEQIIETIFCQSCGQQTSTEFAFCQSCGASLAEEAVASEESNQEKGGLSKLPFKLSKKMITIGSACVAAVLVVVLLLSLVLSGGGDDGKKNHSLLYMKDGELYHTSASKTKPVKMAEDGGYGEYAYLSKDGTKIFYKARVNDESTETALYCRYVNKPKKEAIKIDEDVERYNVSESGKCITYLRDDGGLYQHDLKEKNKIDSDVSSYVVSDDGKKIIYEADDKLYVKQGKKEPEKLDSDISSIKYVNDDFNTVYYTKDDILYKRKLSKKEKEKIASDIESVIRIYESGEIYYVDSNDTLYYYNGKKAKMLSDEYEEYYTSAADKAVIIFESASDSDVYIAVEDTVTLIDQTDAVGFTIDAEGKTVYFGADVDDETNHADLYKMTVSGKKPKKPVKYDSDVYDLDVREDGTVLYLKDVKDGKGDLYIDKVKVDSDVSVYRYAYLEDAGKVLYMTDWNSDNSYGTLKIGKKGKTTKIADDVREYTVTPNEEIFYLHDYSKSSGELSLYKNGKSKKIDSDVSGLIHVYSFGYGN